MKDAAAKIGQTEQEPVALHLCYGRIGISAVAAAARYVGEAKNQAYAPVRVKSEAPETSVA